MPIFTEHLRNEAGVIQFGLNQLERNRQSVLAGGEPNIPDLRIIAYALRLLFERTHVAKLETLLYPALDPAQLDDEGFQVFNEQTERLYNARCKLQLMRLQLALDGFTDRSPRDELARTLGDSVQMLGHMLDHTSNVVLPLADRFLSALQRDELYLKGQELDRKHALERVQATQALMNMDLARASGS